MYSIDVLGFGARAPVEVCIYVFQRLSGFLSCQNFGGERVMMARNFLFTL